MKNSPSAPTFLIDCPLPRHTPVDDIFGPFSLHTFRRSSVYPIGRFYCARFSRRDLSSSRFGHRRAQPNTLKKHGLSHRQGHLGHIMFLSLESITSVETSSEGLARYKSEMCTDM